MTDLGGSTPSAPTGPPLDPAGEEVIHDAFIAHRAELRGLARRALGSDHLAEEAVQETFVRAWRARERFDSSRGSLRTWLFSIERNLLIDMARTRAREEITAAPRSTDGAADEDIEAALVCWQVEEAVLRLTPAHRAVIVELYFRGRTSREVASQLAIPEGTVRSRLFYALKALKVNLETAGWRE